MTLRIPLRPLAGGAATAALAALAVACSAPSGQAAATAETQAPAASAPAQPAGDAPARLAANADAPLVTVYKTPTCGCCNKWVDHLRESGFRVETHDMDDVEPVKVANGLPAGMGSCHTGLVNGYVVEGHVPADVIRRLLREKPQIAGVAVPGMPAGSPGMEGMGKEPYDVMAFTKDGQTRVYESR